MSLQETLNAIKEGMYPNIPPKTRPGLQLFG